jgi:hypothetical protein
MGFSRRFGFFPGLEVITQIEGVVLVDLPPPGSTLGVSTGVAAMVGEFADCSFACSVDGSGVVTTNPVPVEIFSAQDLIDKTGGFDETIGDFGLSEGSGFVALRNKKFSRLILCPVNLAAATGCRYFRALPVCSGTTDPTPVVPVSGAVIPAGTEFRSATSGRMRIAARTVFTARDLISSGSGGATTNGGAAATQTFTVATADFSAVARPDGGIGIKKGDVVVIGNNNAGALQPLPAGGSLGAGTYRVQTDATSGSPTLLVLERMDGTNFAFVTATTIPYRIHVSSDADSAPVIVVGSSVAGGYKASEVGGYSVPTRPLTDVSGASTNGTWTAGAVVTPLVVPPVITGSSWDPLTGLGGRVIPTGGMVYVALVQTPNAAAGALLDALYVSALAALVSDQDPISSINILWSARTSSNIRTAVNTNVNSASGLSAGRIGINRPALVTQTTTAAVASTDPGVGGNRSERIVYTWPGVRTFIPDAAGFRLKVADGTTTIDGVLDVGFDGFLASVLSNLPPERNPGQSAAPVPGILAPVLGLQRGAPNLQLNDYIVLRSSGVASVRMDRTTGPVIQSGITTSLVPGQKNISRRRMADFIEDSLGIVLAPFVKLPLSISNKDSAVSEVDSFLAGLLSTANPAAARIDDYQVDEKSGNTPTTTAAGVFVIIVRVRLTPNGDFIVLQSEIGENVVISQLAA